MSWIAKNAALSQSEMENNAKEVFYGLKARGWTNEAIAATLGNMQAESLINPGAWQNYIVGSGGGGGYGLVQWTPWTHFTDYADQWGVAHDDGNAQLRWIDEITVPFGQWVQTTAYPMTFPAYKVSTEAPEYLSTVFLYNFERPAEYNIVTRQTYARQWYDFIQALPERLAIPIWLLFKFN